MRRLALCFTGAALDRVLLGAAGPCASYVIDVVCGRVVRGRFACGVLFVHQGFLSLLWMIATRTGVRRMVVRTIPATYTTPPHLS